MCNVMEKNKRFKHNSNRNSTKEIDILKEILYEHHIYIESEYINREEDNEGDQYHLNLMNLLMKNYDINSHKKYDESIVCNKSILDLYVLEGLTSSIERIFDKIQLDFMYPICVLFSAEKVFTKVYKNLDEYFHHIDFDKKITTRCDIGSYRNHIVLYKLMKKVDDYDQIVWALTKVVYIELIENKVKVQFQLDENFQRFSEPEKILEFLKLPIKRIMYVKEVEYTAIHKINASYLLRRHKNITLGKMVNYFLHFVYLDHLTKYFFELQNVSQIQYKENGNK